MPKMLIRMGVISDPAPIPVKPTSVPTTSPARISPGSMSIRSPFPPPAGATHNPDQCKRTGGECKFRRVGPRPCLEGENQRERHAEERRHEPAQPVLRAQQP